MKYKEFGDKTHPTVILLHADGLSWWSFEDLITSLKWRYHVVAPIIDGHGEDGETPFISIQDSAQKLIDYIDENCQGKVLAIGGVSLGAQIAVEMLSKRTDITKYAILVSTSVIPAKSIMCFKVLVDKLFYGLMCQKWFAKTQAKIHCVKKDLFEQYYRDSLNISKESLVNMAVSSGEYEVPDTLKNTKAKALIIIGSKEIRRMDQSVRKLMHIIPCSQVCIVPGMKHGELGFIDYSEYWILLKRFMAK